MLEDLVHLMDCSQWTVQRCRLFVRMTRPTDDLLRSTDTRRGNILYWSEASDNRSSPPKSHCTSHQAFARTTIELQVC